MNITTHYCVEDPKVALVFDTDEQDYFTAQQVIGDNYHNLMQLRMQVSERLNSNYKFHCAICQVPVYIICAQNSNGKLFTLRHKVEDCGCPAITRGDVSKDQIEAMKYNGAKESAAHFEMKNMIAESLRIDPEFSNIRIEPVIKGADRRQWRKPDIHAIWRGKLKVSFEVQLSTTFLHVIAQRRQFYKEDGGIVIWVFKQYDKNNAKMTQDDIFYNNNQNLFIVNKETLQASKNNKAMTLEAHWVESMISGPAILDKWNNRFVMFSELTYNLDSQSIYWNDYAGNLERIHLELEACDLKTRFEKWWTSHTSRPEESEEWNAFVNEFTARKMYIPQYTYEISNLLSSLYSAKYGRVIGSHHTKLIQVAHVVSELGDKSVLQTFRVALLTYKRGSQIIEEDKTGRWKSKQKKFRREIYALKEYERKTQLDPLLNYLFPEVMDEKQWALIQRYDEQYLERSK